MWTYLRRQVVHDHRFLIPEWIASWPVSLLRYCISLSSLIGTSLGWHSSRFASSGEWLERSYGTADCSHGAIISDDDPDGCSWTSPPPLVISSRLLSSHGGAILQRLVRQNSGQGQSHVFFLYCFALAPIPEVSA